MSSFREFRYRSFTIGGGVGCPNIMGPKDPHLCSGINSYILESLIYKMPTFREFLAENNVAYSFKTFDQLKGMAQPIPVGQPDLKPKDIGDAINETVSDTLSAFGMSGTAEDLRDHVDAAVEEVQDIIDGQRKKVKFVASAAEVKKTVDKLRKGKKKKEECTYDKETTQVAL
jgi:hypothetical protein